MKRILGLTALALLLAVSLWSFTNAQTAVAPNYPTGPIWQELIR